MKDTKNFDSLAKPIYILRYENEETIDLKADDYLYIVRVIYKNPKDETMRYEFRKHINMDDGYYKVDHYII